MPCRSHTPVLASVANSIIVDINNKRINSLVDTGAAISVINGKLFESLNNSKKLKIEQSHLKNAQGAGGTLLELLGISWIPLKVGKTEICHAFYVSYDIKYDLILGVDFLNTNKAVVSFEENVLYIRNEKVKFCDQYNLSQSIPVISKETVELPPLAQTMIQAKILDNESINPRKYICIVEPENKLSSKKNILGAKALVSPKDETIPLIFVNLQEKPVTIYKNTKLGHITPINEKAQVISLEKQHEEDTFMSFESKKHDKKKERPNVNLDHSNLTKEQKAQLEKLLMSYRDVFANSIEEIGKTSILKHTIDTGDHPPIRQRAYRASPQARLEIERQVEQMLDQGLIAESTSPWASPVILVSKPDGSKRMCVDLRKVNAVTKKDSYPLPRIDECLDSLGGKTMFMSTLDLMSGYYQVEMEEQSREKTAFITPSGLYEWLRMPMGASNAPALFQRLMSHIFKTYQHRFLQIYLDDLVIYSSSFEEHLHHLELVFKRLREVGLTLKSSKCNFARNEIKFLGHVVTRNGIKPNPDKIQIVENFPTPKNKTDVKSFLGLCNYYRRFVKGFASLASPIVRLTRNKVKFEWDTHCQKAFTEIKKALTAELLLIFPDFSKEFILHTDASSEGIGFVLSQIIDGIEKPISFGGRDLSPAERNYSTTERECLAVVEAVKKFEPYLESNPFTVVTDHAALKWLKNIKDPKSRLSKWSLLLQGYDMKIIHRSGVSHGNADALSRIKHGTTVCALSNDELTKTSLAEAQRKDKRLSDMIVYLTDGLLPNSKKEARKIILSSENYAINEYQELEHVLRKKIGQPDHYEYVRQLVIPKSLQAEIISSLHDDQAGGAHFVRKRK